MKILENRLNQAYADAGATINEAEQKRIDEIQKHIDTVEKAISKYDGTLATLEEQEEAILAALDEIMRKNYEVLTYKLEIELDLNDAEL